MVCQLGDELVAKTGRKLHLCGESFLICLKFLLNRLHNLVL